MSSTQWLHSTLPHCAGIVTVAYRVLELLSRKSKKVKNPLPRCWPPHHRTKALAIAGHRSPQGNVDTKVGGIGKLRTSRRYDSCRTALYRPERTIPSASTHVGHLDCRYHAAFDRMRFRDGFRRSGCELARMRFRDGFRRSGCELARRTDLRRSLRLHCS